MILRIRSYRIGETRGEMFSKREWAILFALVVLVLAVYGGFLVVVTRSRGAEVESAVPRPTHSQPARTTQQAYPLAVEVARAWQPDARLSHASGAWGSGVSPQELLEGETTWGFHFISAGARQFCVVSVVGGQARVIESGSIPRAPILLEVADWHVDSPQALSIFLDHGGRDFLAAHADADVHLRLLTSVENGTLLWLAVGLSASDGLAHTVPVDAVTGAVVEIR
jgi:hypothetical protein